LAGAVKVTTEEQRDWKTAITEMDHLLHDREEEKAHAVDAIGQALSTIEANGRELDQWERAFMVQAIGWLYRGGYRFALMDAELALTPRAQRSPTSNLHDDPLLDRCNVTLLRKALHEAQREPVRAFPALGPIVFER
jgi:hypothetical protein